MFIGYSPAPLFLPPLRGSNPRDWKHARGEKVRGGSELHDQRYVRSGGLNHLTSDVLGAERLPWGKVLVFPVLPIAGHPGLSTLVTFCTWPVILAPLMSVCLPQKYPGGSVL